MAAPASPTPGDELPIDVALIKVLASDSRRDILRLLGERRRTLTELSDALNLKKATVLEHLKKLVESGLIRRLDEDERLWIYYELTPQGNRLVRPQRTRFYLVLAGSAVAVVLLGAIVAAALLWSPGQDATAPPLDGDVLLSDARGASGPLVAWRGIDEEVALSFADVTAADGTLVVGPSDAPLALVPAAHGAASLDAAAIDGLPPGAHALALRTPAGDLPLRRAIEVRDPPVVVEPLVLTEGRATTLRVHAGDPALPAASVASITVDGETIPVENGTVLLPAQDAGNLTLQVGRLASIDLLVLPDIAASIERVNESAEVKVEDRGSPLERATLRLDGDPLGTTDVEGVLAFPWPADGTRVLSIEAPDGRAATHALAFNGGGASAILPDLALDAFHGGGPGVLSAHVQVRNDGAADQTVTLLARLKGVPVAATLVNVPANGSATTMLRADVLLDAPVDIVANAARATLTPRFDGYVMTGTSAPLPMAPASQPDGHAADDAAREPRRAALFSYSGAADARVTLPALVADAAPPSAAALEAPPSARVPAPALVLVIVAVGVVALTRARRRA